MRKSIQLVLIFLALNALSGCVFQPAMSQGNLLKQEDVDWADVIVVVREILRDMFLELYSLGTVLTR